MGCCDDAAATLARLRSLVCDEDGAFGSWLGCVAGIMVVCLSMKLSIILSG